MIIGYDASRANKPNRTGTEWYSFHLLRHLAKIDGKNRYRLYTREPLREDMQGLGDNLKEKVLNWPPRYLWTLVRLSWEMFRNPPDLLFVTAHTMPLWRPKKSVVTIHDIGFSRLPHLYKWKQKIYHPFVLWFASRFASKIITISQFTKDELTRKYGMNPDRIAVIPISFDRESFRPIEDQERKREVTERYGINGPYMFFIGRLEKKKNVLRLVQAFDRFRSKSDEFKDWKLVLVGSPNFGWDEAKRYIKEHDLEKHVITPGWVKQEDVPVLMAASSMFVFPSLYEGFGIPVLEAMACGVPVAASRAASLPEVCGDAAALFNPYDADDMAEVMERVASDEELRADLVARGLERAKQYTWERCARETLSVLESIENEVSSE